MAMNPRNPARRRVLRGLASLAIAAPTVTRAQPNTDDYPTRPITMLVPWPAGGATDLTLRLLGDLAARRLGQRVIVDNRAGASGTLAMPALVQAQPDGYTIAQMPQTVFRLPHLQPVPWNPVRDTTPIIQISGVTFGVVVAADSELRSLDEVLAYALAHPGLLTVATNGVGGTAHLVIDELMRRRGASYIHVPYKGTAEQMIAVASKQVMVGVNSTGFAPFVDNGSLRLLVTFGDQRTRRWPQVPTLKELGHGIVAMSPYGLAGPRGLPPAIVRTLHDAFRDAMHDPAHVAELAKYDQDLAYLDPDRYGQAMRDAYEAERLNVERLGLARPGS